LRRGDDGIGGRSVSGEAGCCEAGRGWAVSGKAGRGEAVSGAAVSGEAGRGGGAPIAGRALVGNDVVDLAAPAARGKAADGRFLHRVFTAGEIARIRAAADPDRMLWMLWAAKEAAFKVARKLRADLPFAPPRFEAWLDPTAPDGDGVRPSGGVRLHGWRGLGLSWLPVEWRATDSLVHCVARSVAERASSVRYAAVAVAAREMDRYTAGGELTQRERDGVRSDESRHVRRLAKALARQAGLGLVEIVRERRGALLGPPRLYAPAAAAPLAGWDLSLSHDGRFVAAALAGER
jgi:hypothetical protein